MTEQGAILYCACGKKLERSGPLLVPFHELKRLWRNAHHRPGCYAVSLMEYEELERVRMALRRQPKRETVIPLSV